MIPKLIILGLLSKKDMHGYEIIKKINDEMTNFCDIKIGSIYFAINNLLKHELIESKGIIKGKKEPDKTIYGITEKGKEQYVKTLRQSFLKTYAGRYPIDIALHFKDDLQDTDYRRIIADKVYITERVVETIKTLLNEEEDNTKKLILKHQLMHQKCELDWLNSLLDENQE